MKVSPIDGDILSSVLLSRMVRILRAKTGSVEDDQVGANRESEHATTNSMCYLQVIAPSAL